METCIEGNAVAKQVFPVSSIVIFFSRRYILYTTSIAKSYGDVAKVTCFRVGENGHEREKGKT
jgi:hypothetical protein